MFSPVTINKKTYYYSTYAAVGGQFSGQLVSRPCVH